MKVMAMALHTLGAEHHSERQAQILQDRALLNMQFQVRGRVLLLWLGFRETIDLNAAPA